MIEITEISELPRNPAIYVMYGGQEHRMYVAYVGSTSKLKDRIVQHLVRRDSSVTTGASATALLPDKVTELHWWEHTDFADKIKLYAAEMVAFDIFEPALRSRGVLQNDAIELFDNPNFKAKMTELFSNPPTGRLILPTLNVAFERLQSLEKRVAELEAEVKRLNNPC